MRTHNGFPTIQIKDGRSDLDLAFVFVYIYNRAHHPHEMVPGVYIKSWGVFFSTCPHTTYHHTLFFHKFSQIISFFSSILLFFLIY